jgi:hypothetical protein
VNLEASGAPLHSRSLDVGLAARADGRLDLRGEILDLRKRGCVPVAGALQGSGLVHHMRVRGVVDPAGRSLDEIEVDQPAVAFEPGPRTRGESCRDLAPRVARLAGAALDRGFARRVGAEIGGPRGCTHVFSLVQLAGASAAFARERAGALRRSLPAGARLFQRSLVFDGFELEGARLLVAMQMNDLHLAEPPEAPPPWERLAAQRTLLASVEIEVASLSIASIRAAQRERAQLTDAGGWRSLDAELEGLAGLALRSGVAPELLRRLGGEGAERPLLDALLQLAPAAQQCLAALEGLWQAAAREPDGGTGVGSFPDSCYMWRRGGALDALRGGREVVDPTRTQAEASRRSEAGS